MSGFAVGIALSALQALNPHQPVGGTLIGARYPVGGAPIRGDDPVLNEMNRRSGQAGTLIKRGLAKEKAGDWRGAMADMEEAQRLTTSMPNMATSPSQWEQLGIVYERLGEIDKARVACGNAVDESHGNTSSGFLQPRWHARYAELCRECGLMETADAEYRKTVKLFWYVNEFGNFTCGWDTMQGSELRQAAMAAAGICVAEDHMEDPSPWREKVFEIDPTSVYADLVRADIWRFTNTENHTAFLGVAEYHAKGELRRRIHWMRLAMPDCNCGGMLWPIPGEEPIPGNVVDRETMRKRLTAEHSDRVPPPGLLEGWLHADYSQSGAPVTLAGEPGWGVDPAARAHALEIARQMVTKGAGPSQVGLGRGH